MRVNSKEFFRAVEYAAKARARGGNIPELAGIRIDAMPGRIRVMATDLEVLVETEVPAEGDDTWQVLVDPRGLRPVKALAGEWVELSIRPADREESRNRGQDLVVQTGPEEETQLVGIQPDQWPEWGRDLPYLCGIAEIGPWEFALLPHLLAHRYEDEGTRPALSGVYLDRDGLTATDAARLLHVPLRQGAVELDGIPGANLRARAIELLLSSPYETRTVTIRVTGEPPQENRGPEPVVAVLESGPVRVWTRLIEYAFPPYRRVFPPENHRHQFVLEPEQFPRLRKVLQAADALARRGPGIVWLRFRGDQVAVEAHQADLGTLRSRIPVNRWDGTLEAEAAYQAGFLRDMLATFETLGEPVYAALNPSGDPGYFLSPSGVICAIMPWRS